MRKFWKENKKVILPILLIAFLFPVIILVPAQMGWIPGNVGMEIVGYGGSILGGFLTLYGVWWTIDDNRRNRKEELELLYSPFLKLDIVDGKKQIHQLCSELTVLFSHPYFNNNDLQYCYSLIKISNVGRGEIKNLNVHFRDCRVFEAPHDVFPEGISPGQSYVLGDGRFNCIPVGGSQYWYVGLPKLIDEGRKKVGKNASILMEATLDISFEGVFTDRIYHYMLHFCMDIPLEHMRKSRIYSTTLILQ